MKSKNANITLGKKFNIHVTYKKTQRKLINRSTVNNAKN